MGYPGRMHIDTRHFRSALGWFATGVTIITARRSDGELFGITANSFNSVSLDPPLVLFSLDRRALSLAAFEDAGCFAINVLREEQEELSSLFARQGAAKFANLDYEIWETGAPVLSGTLASFDCRTRSTHDGGDHIIFLGHVVRYRADDHGRPLLYFRGKYSRIHDIH